MIRAATILLIMLATGHIAISQQKPQYTQYAFNQYLLNPAFAGLENYTDVKLGYRSQWQGIEGRPVTRYLTATTPLGAGFLNGGAGSGNPAERSYTPNYVAAEPHHGIGLLVQSDEAGLIKQTTVQAGYAYHLGLTREFSLATGFSAGFNQYSFDAGKATTEFPDRAVNGSHNLWNPDLTVGVVGYGDNFFIGISAQQLFPHQIIETGTGENNAVPHFSLSIGGKTYLDDNISVVPSVLVRLARPAPPAFDAGLKVAFRDAFWVGGAYRYHDSMSGLLGFTVNSFLTVGYAYDRGTSALRSVSSGSHEIVVGLMLNNRYRVKCPRFNF